jgi:hypothetical protein
LVYWRHAEPAIFSARGPAADIIGNDFDSTGLTAPSRRWSALRLVGRGLAAARARGTRHG